MEIQSINVKEKSLGIVPEITVKIARKIFILYAFLAVSNLIFYTLFHFLSFSHCILILFLSFHELWNLNDRDQEENKYLGIMNEVTDLLETIDFPEAVTGGLRRTTDQLRSVVERTRGDVTLSLDRKKLENN